MNVEVVVARYCEDLSWIEKAQASGVFLPNWKVTIYDKSNGGPRQRLETSMYRSPTGPDEAPVWPGAVTLVNIGCEANTYLHHIVSHYCRLADYTVFLLGTPHLPIEAL